jgi:hypothetical protein
MSAQTTRGTTASTSRWAKVNRGCLLAITLSILSGSASPPFFSVACLPEAATSPLVKAAAGVRLNAIKTHSKTGE